jgi:phosphatidylserine/phosphatidylglycerophosphate/cardiolipin synthase-like enzyme
MPAFALVEQGFARASGAPLVPGNDVRLLKDAAQNYPAWREAIDAARRTIHFETLRRRGSAGRAAAGAVSIGSAVGAAMTGRRVLGPAEARIMGAAGVVLLVLALLATIWPRVIAVPLAVIATWLGVTLLLRARTLHRERLKALQADRRDEP